jgi:polyhydroxyalkanoate synthesis regulator phasin
MARDGWFDGRGLELNNSTVRARRADWERMLSDGAITRDDRMRLRQEIYRRLQNLESRLGDQEHAELTEILVGYEMLIEMHEQRQGEA